MAGILDSKTRIMDLILTDEGRRQIRDGDLKIAFASFSDLGTFYQEEDASVAEDASKRVYFEASSRHQDRVVVESNLGVITNFKTAGSYNLNGETVTVTPDSPTNAYETQTLTGSQLSEQSESILESITQNFTDNQLISKEDVFSYKQGFNISDTSLTFRPTSMRPIDMTSFKAPNGSYVPPTLASLDSIEFDSKFAHFPNFKFLPPVNSKSSGEYSSRPLGLYPNLNQKEIMTYADLRKNLEGLEKYEIKFDPTSRDNNILIQPFEINNVTGTVNKLIVIDFGVFPNVNASASGVHVFFVGKLLKSRDGSLKFINIFTLELDT